MTAASTSGHSRQAAPSGASFAVHECTVWAMMGFFKLLGDEADMEEIPEREELTGLSRGDGVSDCHRGMGG